MSVKSRIAWDQGDSPGGRIYTTHVKNLEFDPWHGMNPQGLSGFKTELLDDFARSGSFRKKVKQKSLNIKVKLEDCGAV